jgi:uncharacterized protein YjbJ (UPF0337 family)
MHNDQAKDRLKEAQDKAKEATGKGIGDKPPEFRGKLGRASGKGQGLYGDVRANLRKSSGQTPR